MASITEYRSQITELGQELYNRAYTLLMQETEAGISVTAQLRELESIREQMDLSYYEPNLKAVDIKRSLAPDTSSSFDTLTAEAVDNPFTNKQARSLFDGITKFRKKLGIFLSSPDKKH